MNGWNLQITPIRKEKSSEPNLQGIMLQNVNLPGCIFELPPPIGIRFKDGINPILRSPEL